MNHPSPEIYNNQPESKIAHIVGHTLAPMHRYMDDLFARVAGRPGLENYFTPRDSEIGIYEALGVRRFGNVLKTTIQRGEPLHTLGDGSLDSLERRELRTRADELAHLGGIALFGALALVTHELKADPVAITFTAAQLPGNIYPMMLQRWNRARLRPLIEHRRRQKARNLN